ncbi:hypothetical protein BTVI_55875 [Pitangus sulphuratus]|nr:hypothetical protein BTVI_55875 [Pitangus sulphuratus]
MAARLCSNSPIRPGANAVTLAVTPLLQEESYSLLQEESCSLLQEESCPQRSQGGNQGTARSLKKTGNEESDEKSDEKKSGTFLT